MNYEKLFSPIVMRGCVFTNRIMSTAAVTRLASEDGHVTAAILERYKRMARGGLGAMVVEAAVVLPSKSSFNLRINDDQFVPELRGFVDEIRKVNPSLKIGLQLIHFLKVARSGWRQRVEDLTIEEIQMIPGQFASGALRARAAGFDFVELHMAHFTTLASFLSLVNKRQDPYGGDFEGRLKLPLEVILAVRGTGRGDLTIGVRINGEEFIKEGNTLLQSTRIAKGLAQAGVDYISVSAGERFEDAEPPLPNFPPFAGTGYSGYRMSPRWWNPDGPQVYLAEGIRKAVREAGFDMPIVTAGKIRTPELAEEILEQGKADIIGMARPLLADPDWPVKAQEGRAEDIVKCAACGYCSEADERYETVTCIEWPEDTLNAPSPWLLIPPCKAECPVGLDVRSYIEFATQGQYEKALNVIEEKIPLPNTIGRVCPHPCESKCNRRNLDRSIDINGLKRFIVDAMASKPGRKQVTPPYKNKRENVAIIGAGPAGLTAAFDLVHLGYGVTIYEALPVAGGMLTVGIPDYRLPKDIVQKEIEDIQKCGVEIKLNHPIGKNGWTLDSLWQRNYKAIFIATGAHKSLELNIPGEKLDGVYPGTSFLKEVKLRKNVRIGMKVAVVGGGNVAIDAARTALRSGSGEVFVVYRRTREEMPAYEEEVKAAEEEGIKIFFLTAPSKIIGRDGKVAGLECLCTELDEPDESGRRRPVPIKGSDFTIETDTVISAIGEVPDLSFLDVEKFEVTSDKALMVYPQTLMTSIEGIFAGGDVVSGPSTVIEAIAYGRKAAIAMDKFLRGESLDDDGPVPGMIGFEDIDTERFNKRERQKMSTLPPEERIQNFKEVNVGYTEREALCEADRCFQCGMFPRKDRKKARPED